MAKKDFYVDIDGLNVNQIIGWRLHNVTTAERTALGATLGAGNAGLKVYDTDLSIEYTWDGAAFVDPSASIVGAVIFKDEITDLSDPVNVEAVAGYQYVIGTAGTLTITGVTFSPSANVEIGDVVTFTSATTAIITQRNDVTASETVEGNIALATEAETIAGVVANKAVTPENFQLGLTDRLDTNQFSRSFFQTGITLVNNTPFTVTHSLDLFDKDAFTVRVCDSSGSEINVDVDSVDVDSITLTARPGATGVKVFLTGYGALL